MSDDRKPDNDQKPAMPDWPDAMKAWREWFIRNERDWSEAMTQMMKNESVARAVGQEINAGLYRQQMMQQGMAGPMAMFNMPTRDDIVALTDRVGRLEDAIARVEAGLVQMRDAQPDVRAARPARTRKPVALDKKAAE